MKHAVPLCYLQLPQATTVCLIVMTWRGVGWHNVVTVSQAQKLHAHYGLLKELLVVLVRQAPGTGWTGAG